MSRIRGYNCTHNRSDYCDDYNCLKLKIHESRICMRHIGNNKFHVTGWREHEGIYKYKNLIWYTRYAPTRRTYEWIDIAHGQISDMLTILRHNLINWPIIQYQSKKTIFKLQHQDIDRYIMLIFVDIIAIDLIM